jgi:endonuclease IV
MVDAQTVGVLVTAASLTVAAIYYIFTLRINMKTQQQTLETRQSQFLMHLFDKMMTYACALVHVHKSYVLNPSSTSEIFEDSALLIYYGLHGG